MSCRKSQEKSIAFRRISLSTEACGHISGQSTFPSGSVRTAEPYGARTHTSLSSDKNLLSIILDLSGAEECARRINAPCDLTRPQMKTTSWPLVSQRTPEQRRRQTLMKISDTASPTRTNGLFHLKTNQQAVSHYALNWHLLASSAQPSGNKNLIHVL